MSDERKGPNVGDILIGTFIILFGLCITLVGGACTVLWLTVLPGHSSSGEGLSGLLLFLVSIAVAALGLFAIYHGVRIARSQYRGPAPPSVERAADKPGDP